MNANGGPDHMRGGGDQSVSLVALACVLLALLLTFGPIWLVRTGDRINSEFAADCESRGGHAEFEPYTTCFDAQGRPEGVPYR